MVNPKALQEDYLKSMERRDWLECDYLADQIEKEAIARGMPKDHPLSYKFKDETKTGDDKS